MTKRGAWVLSAILTGFVLLVVGGIVGGVILRPGAPATEPASGTGAGSGVILPSGPPPAAAEPRGGSAELPRRDRRFEEHERDEHEDHDHHGHERDEHEDHDHHEGQHDDDD